MPSMLVETGAPRTIAMVDGHSTSIILDGGAYANIVSKDFLDHIGNIDIAACDTQFMLADGHQTPYEGVVHDLELNIHRTSCKIDAVVFDHKQYNLLVGRKTLKDFMIITDYENNHFTMQKDRYQVPFPIFYSDPLSHFSPYLDSDPVESFFLCQEVIDMLDLGEDLSMKQTEILYNLICEFKKQLVKDLDALPLAKAKPHEIITSKAHPIFRPPTACLKPEKILWRRSWLICSRLY
ncbi:hypothetical protein DSO57_1034249 [Entomophthora muscae]|uniref:Uncharacterized protein n=1 Tax=Entomophthora muscae TaxID=34485 RepID=A0ACC2REP0_9FUNG|nr:hypothetical protein DSO57_1034249 [Entomophthora muscae]